MCVSVSAMFVRTFGGGKTIVVGTPCPCGDIRQPPHSVRDSGFSLELGLELV